MNFPLKENDQWENWLAAADSWINRTSEIIICLTLQYEVVKINTVAEQLYGQPCASLYSKNYLDICRSEALALYLKRKFSELSNDKEKIILEDALITNLDNHKNSIKWSCDYLIARNSQPFGLLLIGKELQQDGEIIGELTRAKRQLEEALDTIPGSVYWKDKNGVYLGCNKDIVEKSNFSSKSEVIGKTDFDLWPDSAHVIKENDTKVINSGVTLEAVEEVFCNDEKMYYASVKAPLKDELGNIIGVVGTSLDITAFKNAKQRAEEANLAKSEFLAMISHELRIPLSGIIGMAQLLSVDCLLPGQRDQVEDIVKASEHLLSLVNDLLDLTRLEAGKVELHPAPLDLRKLIEDVSNILVFQAKVKGLELLIDYHGQVPNLVMGDARALRQILLNLLGNAVKFTERGYIVVSVKSLRQKEDQVLLEITVKDTGIGIPIDKLQQIFDRFNQADSSYSRRYGGLGMGLTLSKAYIELMGGHMHVESKVEHGSQFTCTIPFALQTAYSEESTWDAYKSEVRVLIVDDTLRGEVLYKLIGSSLACITNGAEALNTLLTAQRRKESFDIVIIDQQLTSIDAMQLGYTINNQAGLTRPMLLLLMPPSPITAKERAKVAGFYDCITKPIHPTEFLTMLTATWEKWRDKNRRKKTAKAAIAVQWRVLLVEDSPVVQRVHIKMLEKLGCQVDLAENAQQALAMSASDYDLIFMDVGLPEVSGLEVTEKIRMRDVNRRRVPIIAITGFAHEEDRTNCLKAGMDDIAIKPVKPEDLKMLLLKWANKSITGPEQNSA